MVPIPHQSSVWSNDNKEFVPVYERLSNFYRKYNKILLDNIAIAKEKERLQLENAQLQDLIKQYVDGLHISNEILADDNPLFVVNGRANLNHELPVKRMRPVIQDATQIRSTAMRQHQAPSY